MPREYIRVGRILRPHGVKGVVKMEVLTERPARLNQSPAFYLEQRKGGGAIAYDAEDVKLQADGALLKLKGVDSREEAETLRDSYVCLKREQLPLPEGRWFIDDLIGCDVCDSEGRDWGKLCDVLQHGAADVYVVRGEKEILFPATKAVLREVDTEGKRILLDAEILRQVIVEND